MKRPLRCLFAVLFVVLAIAACWQWREAKRAFQEAPRLTMLRLIKSLESNDDAKREQAFAELDKILTDANAVFGSIVRGRTPPDRWHDRVELAARLLAKTHGRDTIRPLVESIECRTGRSFLWDAPFGGYPCAEALAQIGQSSVLEILRFLRETKEGDVSDGAVKLYAGVIRSVYEGADEARAAVERFRERSSPYGLENLDRLLQQLAEESTLGGEPAVQSQFPERKLP